MDYKALKAGDVVHYYDRGGALRSAYFVKVVGQKKLRVRHKDGVTRLVYTKMRKGKPFVRKEVK